MIGRRALLAGTAAAMVSRFTPGGDPGTGTGPAAGLARPRLDQLYRPPQPQLPPGTSAGTLRARQVLVAGTTGSGVFVYNGAAGPATLEASMTNSNADPYGTATYRGVAVYSVGTPRIAAHMTAGALQFERGPAVVATPAVIGSNDGAPLVMASGQVNPTDVSPSLTLVPVAAGQVGLAELEGTLELFEVAAPPPATGLVSGPRLFGSETSGVLAFVSDTNKGDGGTYAAGRQSLTVSTTTAISSAVAASLPWDQGTAGLPVAAGVTYMFRAVLRAKQITAAVADNFAVTGPAMSASSALWDFMQTGAAGGLDNTSATFVPSGTVGSPAYAVNDGYSVTIDGFFTPSAAGHVNITGAQSAAGDVWDIVQGSLFYIMPIG